MPLKVCSISRTNFNEQFACEACERVFVLKCADFRVIDFNACNARHFNSRIHWRLTCEAQRRSERQRFAVRSTVLLAMSISGVSGDEAQLDFGFEIRVSRNVRH